MSLIKIIFLFYIIFPYEKLFYLALIYAGELKQICSDEKSDTVRKIIDIITQIELIYFEKLATEDGWGPEPRAMNISAMLSWIEDGETRFIDERHNKFHR